ncbi:8-amino-7-oxononanoate synthase [Neisseria sp.]|uniref:8-amino-7-oxononanoate synthase n=1 Tax=Neisseria sp. TaxID=192066 RepID=UPI00359F184F
MTDKFTRHLDALREQGRLRSLPQIEHDGRYIISDGLRMLNCSSNDYLGLANDAELADAFRQRFAGCPLPLASSSSRLLTGGFPVYTELENLLAARFRREAALLFNSGWHANSGILPALAGKDTLILADKLVHASIIDGIRLSGAAYLRYRHNDYAQLETLLASKFEQYQSVIVVTESLFSMDGDAADLPRLVALKRRFENVMLYVDEAHAVGAYGATGLGLAEEGGCIGDIDILVGTFGKALASVGAYAVCSRAMKDYLVNTARPLIFSTALPPLNVAWSLFLFEKLPEFQAQRERLARLSRKLRQAVAEKSGAEVAGAHCIIPYILGENRLAVEKALALRQQGFYCLPIRPPTVPEGSARIRFSVTADMEDEELDRLAACL